MPPPPQHDHPSGQSSDNISQSQSAMARSAGVPQRLRNDGMILHPSTHPLQPSAYILVQ